MYHTFPHVSKYKQSTRARELRHVESNVYSEESSCSEEESSDSCTEETEESIATRGSRSFQGSENIQILEQSSITDDKYFKNQHKKTSKKDQFTQKNLLSPFPSYWGCPTQKEVLGNKCLKVSNIMPISEEQLSFKKREKTPPAASRGKELTRRSHKLGEDGHSPKMIQPENRRRHNYREFSGKVLGPLMEDFTRTFRAGSRRSKVSSRENDSSNLVMKNCPECVAVVQNLSKGYRKDTAYDEKELRSQDFAPSKNREDGKLEKNKGKDVKEKLVYVVEEEGKDATKIETDIFSLNEILAIKKDLIELSEFAKKLKKLKEMKKVSESDQIKKNSCHCHPEELLKDVNKRIEALEARQEELERKSQYGSHKGNPKVESKKNVNPKTSLVSSKNVEMTNLNATAEISCDPKAEILETRPTGLTFNSDVVNELMDIKSQLEKLEKKRMSKEVSNEAMPQKGTNLTKTDRHAIAVFSSKTYILTTENFDKTKIVKEKSKKELTTENVENWLKNVSLEQTNKDVSKLFSENAKREENSLEQMKRMVEFKGQSCSKFSRQENFENQEPQKNRAVGNVEKGVDMSITCFVKNNYTESNEFGEQKKCIMSSSGRIVALMSESSGNPVRISGTESNPQLPPLPVPQEPSPVVQESSPKIVHRSASNGSIPSTILIKRQLKKLKSQFTRKKHRNNIRVIKSKSASTIVSKPEKITPNENIRSFDNTETSTQSYKKYKEGKKEFLKRLEAQFIALARSLGMIDTSTSTYSYSDLMKTVDLDNCDPKKSLEIPNDSKIVMYSSMRRKACKKSSPVPKKSCKKTPKCEKPCREDRKMAKKKRKMEEKCAKVRRKDSCRIKVKKIKKPRCKPPRRYHHHCCRSCVLIHPWHPPCKRTSESCQHVKADNCSEDKNVTYSHSECSSSQLTRESCSYQAEPPPPCQQEYSPPVIPIIKNPTAPERSQKPRRCGLINTNFDLDQGLLRKLFKNIGRCYPAFIHKGVPITQTKYCCSKLQKYSESGSSLQDLEKNYRDAGFYGNSEKVSKKPLNQYQSPPPQRSRRQDTRPPCSRKHFREPPSQSPPKHSRRHSRRHCKKHQWQHLGRCETELAGAFMENKNQSSNSSFKPFELLEDDDNSKTELSRSRKTKEYDEHEPQLLKSNHQIYLVNSISEDPDNQTEKTGKKTSFCMCNRCGHIHQHTYKVNQKATCSKIKREKQNPLLEEKFEDNQRCEYDNYNDYNYGNKSNQYIVCNLDSKYDRCDDHKSNPKPDNCKDLKHCEKCDYCECHKATHKNDLNKDHKVDNYSDCSPRCCESIKSRDSCKRGKIFSFLSFFSQIFRRPRKPEHFCDEDQNRTKRVPADCTCKEKFNCLETRMTKIEDNLALKKSPCLVLKSNESQTTPPKCHKRTRQKMKRNCKCRKRSSDKAREEKKMEKKLKRALRCEKRREKEKRRRLRHIKYCRRTCGIKPETDAFYYTIDTPSLFTPTLQPPAEDKKSSNSKYSFPFRKRINEGLTSLHSFWLNLRNYKLNYGMENFGNKTKQKSRDSVVLVNDSSKYSQLPKTRAFLELNEKPVSFIKKVKKSKKSDKHGEKTEEAPESGSRKGRNR